jgi:hypothetical protein
MDSGVEFLIHLPQQGRINFVFGGNEVRESPRTSGLLCENPWSDGAFQIAVSRHRRCREQSASCRVWIGEAYGLSVRRVALSECVTWRDTNCPGPRLTREGKAGK